MAIHITPEQTKQYGSWRSIMFRLMVVAVGVGIQVGGLIFLKWRLSQPAATEAIPPSNATMVQSAVAKATPNTAASEQQATVVALGRIEPKGEVIDVGGLPNNRLAKLTVAVGDRVKQGQILALLDSYEQQLAERNYAASQLDEAKRQLQGEIRYRQAQIEEAKSRLQQVKQPTQYQIQSQQARINDLQAQLSLAQLEVDRLQHLQQAGAISQQELDQQTTVLRQRQEEVNGAIAELANLQTSWQTDLQNTEAQVQSAQAGLELAEAEATIESATHSLALAEAKLERTIIRAPRSGEVLRILTHPGEMLSGETLGEKQSILQLGDTSQMYVVAEIYETDISRVKVGQPAQITSRGNAFAGSITGVVEQIGQQIYKNEVIDDDPAADTDARVVEVKIRLNHSQAVTALTNLQVDVQVDVSAPAVSSETSPALPSPSSQL